MTDPQASRPPRRRHRSTPASLPGCDRLTVRLKNQLRHAHHTLRDDWGVAADVWSVTSWTELRREALAADAWNLTHPGRPRRIPYVTGRLTTAPGPVTAVSDWMRAVPDQIAP